MKDFHEFKAVMESYAESKIEQTEKKIKSLEKKIDNKRDSLSLAKERRKMKGQRGVQGPREIKLADEISELLQQYVKLTGKAYISK